MSQYSELIDKFIINSLQPELDSLNGMLASMEEFGYNSSIIEATKKKLSRLIPIYDFLKEYVDGNEECTYAILDQLVLLSGLSSLSNISTQAVVDTPLTDYSISGLNYQDSMYIRLFIDNILFNGSPVDSRDEHTIEFIGAVDVDSMIINGTTYNKNKVSFINTLLSPAGRYDYVVTMIKNGVSIFSKTITIESV